VRVVNPPGSAAGTTEQRLSLFVAIGFLLLEATLIESRLEGSGCSCTTYECSCCIDEIPLLKSICANLTWDASTLTVKIELIVDGIVVWSFKISDPNPVVVCVNVGCKVCIGIENLNITNEGACGRIYLNVTCKEGLDHSWDLGKFYLGHNCVVPGIVQSDQKSLDFTEENRYPVNVVDIKADKEEQKNRHQHSKVNKDLSTFEVENKKGEKKNEDEDDDEIEERPYRKNRHDRARHWRENKNQ